MNHRFFSVFVWVQLLSVSFAAEPYLRIEGRDGLGKGQHIVFVTGEEYYRSEEGMSMFAAILARHHGYRCTVLFAIDRATGFINPNKNDHSRFVSVEGCRLDGDVCEIPRIAR